MKGKNGIKDRIVEAAWELFHEKGFADTTLNDIIDAAHVSKGSFYYYFESKDTLLNTLSMILDRQYMVLEDEMKEKGIENCYEQLLYTNAEMHSYMDENIGVELLGNLYSAQIIRKEFGNLIDWNRFYFRLVIAIVENGQRRGEITNRYSVTEVVRMYNLIERALVTDWCMCDGTYPLGEFSRQWMPVLFRDFKAGEDEKISE